MGVPCTRGASSPLVLVRFFCRFQDRQVVGANLRLASESPLLVQARRIALGDRTPVVLANVGSDRYHPGSLASERPVLVVRWGLLSMFVRSLSLSVSCAGVNSWADLYNDHGSAGSGWCARAEESKIVGQQRLQQGLAFVVIVVIASCGRGTGVTAALGLPYRVSTTRRCG